MKKIFDGKSYDTKTAKLIGGNSADCSVTDFHFWESNLYKTKKGNYFVHSIGGPATIYSRSTGSNSWTSGEEIMVFRDRETAFSWAQANLDTEEIEKEFGDLIEEG